MLNFNSIAKKKQDPNSPHTLAQEVARQIEVIFIKEMDQEYAAQEVAKLIYEVFSNEEKMPYFTSVLQSLLNKPESMHYAGLALASLQWQDSDQFRDFLGQLLDVQAKGHWYRTLPDYKHIDSNKYFSIYAYALGESIIQLIKLSNNHYDVVADLYTYLIQFEMNLDRKRMDSKRARGAKTERFEEPKNPKKLYDDLFDYIHERSIYRTDSLSTENPNAFIQLLSDRLRSSRRYTIQDEINKQAITKKRQMEKALKEREASAEEVIFAQKIFPTGLALFEKTKLYNLQYFEIEKKRMTLQIIPILLGSSLLGLWLMEIITLSPTFAGILAASLFLVKPLFSKTTMKSLYPIDVTNQLEINVGQLATILHRCSQKQLEALLRNQVKALSKEPNLTRLIPEFCNYIYTVMPRKKNALVDREDLIQTTDRIKYYIAKNLKAS